MKTPATARGTSPPAPHRQGPQAQGVTVRQFTVAYQDCRLYGISSYETYLYLPYILMAVKMEKNFIPEGVRLFLTGLSEISWAVRRRLQQEPVPPDGAGAVSVVIPTLCKGAHAHRLGALEKLLTVHLPEQTYPHYEAIVVADGPNPDVEAMIARSGDPRITYLHTEETTALWGHPQTRMGIMASQGTYFVRLNDDNKPYRDYLATLVNGIRQGFQVSYARVVFKMEAREYWKSYFQRNTTYILPTDRNGSLYSDNMDCMNYMTTLALARQWADAWDDRIDADWLFLEAVLKSGAAPIFIDRLIGDKC